MEAIESSSQAGFSHCPVIYKSKFSWDPFLLWFARSLQWCI
jgi:hypothetical protein